MKKLTITIALVTMASLAVFASGSVEETTNNMPWAQGRGQFQSEAVLSGETTQITGTINLVENGHVELIVGNEKYELIYPYRLSYDADLQDGMEVTIEGFEAENLRYDNDTATKNIVVQKATIHGQTYDLTEVSGSVGGYGRMAGNTQNRGYAANGRGTGGQGAQNGNSNYNRGGNNSNRGKGRGNMSGRISSGQGGNFSRNSNNQINNFFKWHR